MAKKQILFSLFTVILFSLQLSLSAQQTNKADIILGKWVTEEGKSVVEVTKKTDGKYYAKILSLKDPVDKETGKEKLDKENPEEKLRSRTVVGIEFMKGFVYNAEDEEWQGDFLYDPESGSTYSGYMKLKDKNTLDLRGYIGISLFGRTSTWTRKGNK